MDFPLFHQRGASDCGTASLMMIAMYYGLEIPYDAICSMCNLSSEGISMYDLNMSARKLGFDTVVLRCNAKEIMDRIPLPVILYWKQKHFSVLYDITGGLFHVADPIGGFNSYPESVFATEWNQDGKDTGILLALERE